MITINQTLHFKEFFTNQFKDNQKKLYLIALSILQNHSYAEDAIQEAALKAYKKIKTVKNLDYFSTWMIRILINECKMILRKNNKIMLPIEQLSLFESVQNFDQKQWDFFELISKLDIKEKEIITLRYFYQMSLEDMAQTLKIPTSTVKSRLYRTLEKLKSDWSDIDEL